MLPSLDRTTLDTSVCGSHSSAVVTSGLQPATACGPDKPNSLRLIKTLTLIGVVIILWACWANREDILYTYKSLYSIPLGRIYILVGWCVLTINCLVFLYHLVLAVLYRRGSICHDSQLPSCTVVVAAYNEGQQVFHSLVSIAASDYPAGKLHIIAVDDGSQDDTWSWISKAAQVSGNLIQTVRLESNQGKRLALCEAFRVSRGDILVTVDSDTIIEKQALHKLMGPFYRNPRIGSVAGNIRSLNRVRGIIPCMLEVSFTYAFDFIRAGQSAVSTVMCTPGAFSAYRRDVVLRNIYLWRSQTWRGRRVSTGEDRALTNLILQGGCHVVFEQDAVAYTAVPASYSGLCGMLLRWARSDVRETLIMAGYVFGHFRDSSALGARINLVIHLMGLTVSQVVFVTAMLCCLWRPHAFGIPLLGAAIIKSMPSVALYAWKYRNSDALMGFLYGLLWVFGLSWIVPYSWFTLHRDGWLTRESVTAVSD